MLDFKKIADILAPLPGKTALLIKDKTGVLYAGPLAGEEFKSASLIKLAVACYYQAHPQDLSQMVHVPEDKILVRISKTSLHEDGPCPGRQDR
ncbi:hypothetical protein LOB53_05530 [Lactobacillus delbrueckii subsp. lactis]|uniref:hypothetical protein n=1 Tax=Lactobacillus delbrueckii TaxID=1584 RepID=UPI001E462A96|nr:hypothetical protein [Lactobacillus delbrueckii]MCD5561689.1 hypothetical protein [Lactobacillus delbrueckii subsp. lactis]